MVSNTTLPFGNDARDVVKVLGDGSLDGPVDDGGGNGAAGVVRVQRAVAHSPVLSALREHVASVGHHAHRGGVGLLGGVRAGPLARHVALVVCGEAQPLSEHVVAVGERPRILDEPVDGRRLVFRILLNRLA